MCVSDLPVVNDPLWPTRMVDLVVLPLRYDRMRNYHIDEGCTYEPEEPIWSYNCDFYAVFLGGTQRLSNGNTLICDGARGKFFEVTYNDKEIVWRYDNLFPYPLTSETRLGLFPFSLLYYSTDVFKINRYPPDYPGLKRLFGLK